MAVQGIGCIEDSVEGVQVGVGRPVCEIAVGLNSTSMDGGE